MTRAQLRRLWFQVHKWIGLALAIVFIPLSLSGSLLVWTEPVARMSHPEWYRVSGGQTLPPGQYVAAATAALRPGERPTMLALPRGEGPVTIAAQSVGPMHGGPRLTLYLDPPTARVLGVERGRGGLLAWAHDFHGALMIQGAGRAIVGWLGVFMALSCVTGLWLWWPVTGSVRRGFRWRRQPGTDANLHHLLGFWIALPLFMLSVTGVWIAAPQMLGGGGRRPQPPRPAPPRMTPETALASAQAIVPGDLRALAWPAAQSPDWTVTLAAEHGPVRVAVPDGGGSAHVVPRQPQRGPLYRRVHSGEGLGMVWQAIVFIAGIAPAILGVTGVIMWWRARSWRKKAARRVVA